MFLIDGKSVQSAPHNTDFTLSHQIQKHFRPFCRWTPHIVHTCISSPQRVRDEDLQLQFLWRKLIVTWKAFTNDTGLYTSRVLPLRKYYFLVRMCEYCKKASRYNLVMIPTKQQNILLKQLIRTRTKTRLSVDWCQWVYVGGQGLSELRRLWWVGAVPQSYIPWS